MIVTKTPVRISLFSGGSDLPAFFHKEDGAALSVTIDKYIYVMVHPTFNPGIRLKFDQVEHAEKLDDVKHIITKEALRYAYGPNLVSGWEIASVSDVSYNGCGLGTSSAFTVGLLNALLSKSEYRNTQLANDACTIEIVNCGFPIGKQDQFAAAFGGMNLFQFEKSGRVRVTKANGQWTDQFQDKLIMFYTGIERDGNVILKDQSASMNDPIKFAHVQKNRDRAFEAMRYMFDGDYDAVGDLFNQSWAEKKQISKGITNSSLDDMYNIAMANGALGGKLLGAGGGGFFLFYAPTWDDKQKIIHGFEQFQKVYGQLLNVKPLDFKFSYEGSKVIYNDRET
jgi:D-glycero-alpha-D-manno-heptose-7-phosphate kinase